MKVAAVCVLCAMVAAAIGTTGTARANPGASEGVMEVSLDVQNHRLTIVIVSEEVLSYSFNFTIAHKKVLIVQEAGTGVYYGATDVKIKVKEHKEVYKVIPKGDIDGSGMIVRFNCTPNGLQATFLDDHTVRLGPFHVALDGSTIGGVVPLIMEPNQDDTW
ncbi:MAG: hypothetical protein HZB92_03250 [Euryarchaeota archaeon]|nr:hypothetical protein [Euryarchaeota archaeon]